MKFKSLKNLTLGIACLMMVLTLATPFISPSNSNIQIIRPMQDMPVD